MNKIKQLFESEEMQGFTEANEELLNEMTQATENFADVMYEYILRNPTVFIDSTPDGIKRNIRIFSEAAMCQFLIEVSEAYAPHAKLAKPIVEDPDGLGDYL